MVETNLDDFDRWINRLADRKIRNLSRSMREEFKRTAAIWRHEMDLRLRGPLVIGRPKSRSALLASRRGSAGLAGAFFDVVRGDFGLQRQTLELRMGNRSHYAVTHELGTVGAGGRMPDITPKRARALTIPLEAALTPSGNPREPNARAWPGTFILRTGPDAAFIVQRDGEELVFLYRLAQRAAIPPRLGMVDTFRKDGKRRSERFLAAIRRAMAS